MKKILVIVAVIVTIGVIGFGLNQLINDDDATTNQTQQATPSQTAEQAPSNSMQDPQSEEQSDNTQTTGAYVDYSDSAIANADGERFLFFHAPWCPQCRSIEDGINSDGVPSGVTIIKVDYDSNQDLRAKYGVTLQTTFVKVDQNGQLIEKFVAYNDPYFSSVVRDFINKES